MAEAIGLAASAVTLAATAHGAAKLATAIFKVTSTFRNARKEMADIAQRLAQFSSSLQVLSEILSNNELLCKPTLWANTKNIIHGWNQVEAQLKRLLETPSGLQRLIWTIKKPMARSLLKNIECIEKALMMQLSVLQLAVIMQSPVNHTLPNAQNVDQVTAQRKITESVVQANRQTVESAQEEEVQSKAVDQHRNRHVELDLQRQYSFDTATWLYHLVFGRSTSETSAEGSHQPTVDEDDSDKNFGSVNLPQHSDSIKPEVPMPPVREMIVWGARTEPSSVVDRLLLDWTTLSSEQIMANSAHNENDKWMQNFLKILQETKDEEVILGKAGSDTDELSMTGNHPESSEERIKNKARKVHGAESSKRPHSISQPSATAPAPPRHVNFHDDEEKPYKLTSKSGPSSAPTSKSRSTSVHRTSIPAGSERTRRPSQGPLNPARHSQFTPSQGMSPFPPYAANMQPYTGPSFRSQYPLSRPAMPHHSISPSWSPYPDLPPAYPLPQPLSAPVVGPSATPQQPQESTLPSAENTIRSAIIEDPRLSRIESLLAAQQDKKDKNHAADFDARASENYGRIIERLEILLSQQREELQRTEEDLSAERSQLAAVTHEHSMTISTLEQSLAQQREERFHAEERHRAEVQALKIQVDRAGDAKDAAVRDAAAAQSAAEKAREHLDSVKVEIEAQKILIEQREAATTKAKREADEETVKAFQRYEKLLKASQQAPQKKSEPVIHQPLRQTRLMDRYHSIEVNEFAPDASDTLPDLPFSPLRFFQNSTRRADSEVQYYESNRRPTRERHNSFHSSSNSVQSPRSPLAPMVRAGSSQEGQQMLLLPPTADRNSIVTSQLQQYLDKSSVTTIFDDPQDGNDGRLVPYTEESAQIVRSTLFWEPPALSLGSELLQTMKLSGWKPLYSRKSAAGRTYFHGDQPIHSYFFKPNYTPQFLPPICPKRQDVLMIDGALIEENALVELNFKFSRTTTAEYELEGWLTFNDIEGLIERSFLIRESCYRAHYRKPPVVQQWLNQPATPATQTTFSRDYPPSEASTATRSSRSSRSSTERAQSDDEGFQTSQTSQPDISDEKSVFDKGDDVARPPSVASWVKTTTNPFSGSRTKAKVEQDRNPYRQGSLNGPSLIDL
ncbi:hypothetical protein E8E11_008717 [Didymella keratinophila]|nr:hypothetical protein E8E11_008717 [Didymella keratinophila]